MKRIKLAHSFLSVLVLAVLLSKILPIAWANEADAFDVMLILDSSRAMRSGDPEMLALAGAKHVLDLMQEKSGWRYGAVMFADEVTGEIPLCDVDSWAAVRVIKSELDRRYRRTGAYTDAPLALGRAMHLFAENGDIANSKAIIAIINDENDPPREADSLEFERKEITALAQELNVPIYFIIVNKDGSLLQNDVFRIAYDTEGKIYKAMSMDQIELALGDILGDLQKKSGVLLPEYLPSPTALPTPDPVPSEPAATMPSSHPEQTPDAEIEPPEEFSPAHIPSSPVPLSIFLLSGAGVIVAFIIIYAFVRFWGSCIGANLCVELRSRGHYPDGITFNLPFARRWDCRASLYKALKIYKYKNIPKSAKCILLAGTKDSVVFESTNKRGCRAEITSTSESGFSNKFFLSKTAQGDLDKNCITVRSNDPYGTTFKITIEPHVKQKEFVKSQT